MAEATDPEPGRDGRPRRTCIGCRAVRSQEDLLRFVMLDDATLAVGRTLPGRGAWLCRASAECRDLAVHRGGLSRAFRRPVTPAEAENLRSVLLAGEDTRTNDFPSGDPPARD